MWRCLALGLGPLAAANRIWPEDAPTDSASLRSNSDFVCARVGREPEEILRGVDYVVPDLILEPPGGPGSLPEVLVNFREEQVGKLLSKTQERCGEARNEPEVCEGAWMEYLSSLLLPFGIPFILFVIYVFLWCTCCYVACCRCCRRMLCCKEGLEPQKTSRSFLACGLLLWSLASLLSLALAFPVLEANEALHTGVNWNLCVAHRFAHEILHGSSWFLGMEPALKRFHSASLALDVDGLPVITLNEVMNKSEHFEQLYTSLRDRLARFGTTLSFGRRYDHRCVFCNLARGAGPGVPLPPPTYPAQGLLAALDAELSESSASALQEIRQAARQLMGQNLTVLTQRLKNANASFSFFNEAVVKEAITSLWVKNRPHIDVVESLRHFGFVSIVVVASASSIVGWLALLRTRLRQRKARPPSGRLHLMSWCCAFLHLVLAQAVGGSMLLLAVPVSEACIFLREELLTHEGLRQYAPVFGVVAQGDSSAELQAVQAAIGLAQACFARNRTGDMLGAVDVDLSFAAPIIDAFYQLDHRKNEVTLGLQFAEHLEQLLSAAENYGEMFILDPYEADNLTGSYGPLQVSSSIEQLILSSGLKAFDEVAPDQITRVRGLNAYAELIAGPGQYTFFHGTAGGGFVVRFDRPSDLELASLPLEVSNALRYARNKERLISSTELPCPVACSVRDFGRYVVNETQEIKAAAARTTMAAEEIMDLFAQELKSRLLPTLTSLNSLSSRLDCKPMWRRVEDIDRSFCVDVANGMAWSGMLSLGQAAAGLLGLVVQYKIWRRLKDNKILQAELKRYQEKLRRHQRLVARMAEREQVKDEWGGSPDLELHLGETSNFQLHDMN